MRLMDWKKPAAGIGMLAIALVVLGFLFFKQTPLDTLIPVLQAVHPGWLLAGLGCMALYVSLEAMGSRAILRALGNPAVFRRCLGYSALGFCGSSITPSSSGGQPVQVWAMARDGVPVAHGSLTMLLLAVCYQAAMLLCGTAGCLVLGGVPGWGTGVGWLLLLGVSVNLVLTAGMLGVMFLPRPAMALTMGTLRLLARLHLVKDLSAAQSRAEQGLQQYAEGAACIRSHPVLVLRVLGIAAAQVCALSLVPWMACLAFGVSASPVTVMATQMVLTLAVAAFPMPGSVGAAEGGFLALFQPILGQSLAAPAMLLSRGMSFYLFLPLCALAGIALSRRRKCLSLRLKPAHSAPVIRQAAK